jgi:hypothetical protein
MPMPRARVNRGTAPSKYSDCVSGSEMDDIVDDVDENETIPKEHLQCDGKVNVTFHISCELIPAWKRAVLNHYIGDDERYMLCHQSTF